MTQRSIFTAVGADRPGLVEEVSEFVFARGGSIEDSRMANLQGQFTIMMLVAGPAETLDRLAADLDGFASTAGLATHLTATAPAIEAPLAAARHRLTGRALDQPGLVHRVANVLREFDVNIESAGHDARGRTRDGRARLRARHRPRRCRSGRRSPALGEELTRRSATS